GCEWYADYCRRYAKGIHVPPLMPQLVLGVALSLFHSFAALVDIWFPDYKRPEKLSKCHRNLPSGEVVTLSSGKISSRIGPAADRIMVLASESRGARHSARAADNTSCLVVRLCEPREQHERGDGQDQAGDLVVIQRFTKNDDADGREQQDHANRIENADRGQLQIFHHEHPAEG